MTRIPLAVTPRGPPAHEPRTFPILPFYELPSSSTRAFFFRIRLYTDSKKKAMSSLCDILTPFGSAR